MPDVPTTANEPLGVGEVRFRIHGPDAETDELVSASVFASKLASLVRALRAADQAANGFQAHDYKIKKLVSSSPTALLIEKPVPKFQRYPTLSGIPAFDDCADAVIIGEPERAMSYGNCAKHLGALATGALKQFGYGEVWTKRDRVIRIDPFLKERAQSIISPARVSMPDTSQWFKGVVDGSFDGTVLEVDLRGALPEIKLVLSAGGQQIDCVCRPDHVEPIRAALQNRVQIFGRAIYDGKSGLPRRVEVTEIEPIGGDGDLSKWRGSFDPFEAPEWEGDDL